VHYVFSFSFFFPQIKEFLFYLISHHNWWVSWENQIKTQKKSCKLLYSTIKLSAEGVIESPCPCKARIYAQALIIPLKPQCPKNWVRSWVFLLPMQWGSMRRKKHKLKKKENPEENPKKRTQNLMNEWTNGSNKKGRKRMEGKQ